MAKQIFLLSPARCDGQRARLLFNPDASFEMAQRIRSEAGAPLGEVFSFLSGLYFRGKLAYARAFARRIAGTQAVWIITTDRGLLSPETPTHLDDLIAFSHVNIAAGDERYIAPLRRDVARLEHELPARASVVLLGSIATGKYVDTLIEAFGSRLLFPSEFVGRGDMSRGGLLLRHAREKHELEYISVLGAVRHGKRPPKLERIR